jgi:hypothetical protein
MYLAKEFENSSLDLISALTWTYWTLGIQIHWNLLTTKSWPELDINMFGFDVHILCFQFSFNYWWKKSE